MSQEETLDPRWKDPDTVTSARMNTPVRASELEGRAWLNTGGERLDLQALRGKIVILDFWSFCCINCLHLSLIHI